MLHVKYLYLLTRHLLTIILGNHWFQHAHRTSLLFMANVRQPAGKPTRIRAFWYQISSEQLLRRSVVVAAVRHVGTHESSCCMNLRTYIIHCLSKLRCIHLVRFLILMTLKVLCKILLQDCSSSACPKNHNPINFVHGVWTHPRGFLGQEPSQSVFKWVYQGPECRNLQKHAWSNFRIHPNTEPKQNRWCHWCTLITTSQLENHRSDQGSHDLAVEIATQLGSIEDRRQQNLQIRLHWRPGGYWRNWSTNQLRVSLRPLASKTSNCWRPNFSDQLEGLIYCHVCS